MIQLTPFLNFLTKFAMIFASQGTPVVVAPAGDTGGLIFPKIFFYFGDICAQQ
jgi:hypothetical protein